MSLSLFKNVVLCFFIVLGISISVGCSTLQIKQSKKSASDGMDNTGGPITDPGKKIKDRSLNTQKTLPEEQEGASNSSSLSKIKSSNPEDILIKEKENKEISIGEGMKESIGSAQVTGITAEEKEAPQNIILHQQKEITDEMPTTSEETKDNTEISIARPTNQELIDSALENWQSSINFWDHGELENAIDSLDSAYAQILKIDDADDPELLQQKEDLRITISRQIIEVYSSRFTVAHGTHKEIPLEMNTHVQKAINLFKGRNRKFFIESYVRSGKYRPAIVRALKEAGLPEELSWLPLIESGFKVRALSSARALGMWQFIASTGYKFGLKRNAWIDERMDTDKSTTAAVAYLTELHSIFGDWTTALAAYNCGEHRVLKHIKAKKIGYLDNFWDLYTKLPSETAFYVPKFLAVLHIINDPKTHGFELPPVDEELNIDVVAINKQAKLKTIAKKLNIPAKELTNMNPELRHHITPNEPYVIKVPHGKGDLLLSKIDEIPAYSLPIESFIIHRVKRGESLSVIADRYKTKVSSIMRINNLRKKNYIKPRWRLKIPTSRYVYTKKIASSSTTGNKKGNQLRYTVKKGDSLWSIANKYKTTVNSIKVLNKLRSSVLRIGQSLTIFSKKRVSE